MNVLLISVRADHGGGPGHIARLMEAAPDDVRFTVACPREQPYWERYAGLAGAGNLIEIPHRAFRLPVLLRLAAAVRQRNIDVVHSHGKGAGIYSRPLRLLTGRQVVHTFHGLHVGAYRSAGRAAYLTLERLLAVPTSCSIAVSPGEASQLREAGLGARLRLIPNGVRIPPHSAQSAPGPPYRVVMMTRYDYQKNAELVISIAEALREQAALESFRFELLGTGPGAADLAGAVRSRGLDPYLRLFGAVDDSSRYLCGAHACLSTSRWEGLPLAVLEAMAHGVPVVATDVVGNRDAVTHGRTGFLYDQGNPRAAAGALLRLAVDPDLWRRISAAARSVATQRYSAERMSAETVACYEALLKQHAAGSRETLIDCGGP